MILIPRKEKDQYKKIKKEFLICDDDDSMAICISIFIYIGINNAYDYSKCILIIYYGNIEKHIDP